MTLVLPKECDPDECERQRIEVQVMDSDLFYKVDPY